MSAPRLEEMLPSQVDAVLAETPWILVPIGAIEWHGHHNPLGLDGLKAHGQLLRVAEQVGGAVYPPIYTGHFTGDEESPYTYMIGKETLVSLLLDLLDGFAAEGFRKAVLLSGHYPNHIFVAREVAETWQERDSAMELLALRENNLPQVSGDHAAIGETSMLLDIHPDLVALDRIRSGSFDPDSAPEKGNWIETPLDHRLHGVVGIDPAHATAEHGATLNHAIVDAIAGWIRHGNIERAHDR